MQRSAATIAPIIKELDVLEGDLLEAVALVRQTKQVLGSLKFPPSTDPERQSSPFESPLGVYPGEPLVVPPSQEAAALSRARQAVQETKKSLRAQLAEITRWNYFFDISKLVDIGIGSLVQSFQAVTPEMLCAALDVFFTTGERDDLVVLLKAGADLNGRVEPGGETALMKAVCHGSMEAVRMLVGFGAGLDVRKADVTRYSALHLAIYNRKPEIARFLVFRGADVNARVLFVGRPLFGAAYEGPVELVDLILTRGADLHAKNGYAQSALHCAARAEPANGGKEIAELLLDRGAEIDGRDNKGETPLNHTTGLSLHSDDSHTLRDHADVAEVLISRGADVNARREDGEPCLHGAAAYGSIRVVTLLLDRGADLHATDQQGNTALHQLARHPRVKVLDTLRLNGPQILPPEFEATMGMILEKRVEIARLLVSRGIDTNAVNNAGQTARQLAREQLQREDPLRAYLRGVTGDDGHSDTEEEDEDDDELENGEEGEEGGE
uniref:Uncharacterized protein n=1 Tax=Chromera velia CCMP2878 TaxID=1169474 RepID=A0A0G4IF08_9ALVE|eukprot:Cvel_13896.t1-p1 / transcript=Cvel_13896.t1 / gene=Cvel_13896 / organism=Chromera_velia_CCMP2878 / gene_product=Putative ankyrin repeat protein RF_0381, putative / transcript_product=Putative ankyrin repeat protein RF_0381, putative / location=Cvel_scaffold968:16740-18227(-) / protein_length=496 / sequence_SO=supercontig / SO=protein_coding / is_pseudo=false